MAEMRYAICALFGLFASLVKRILIPDVHCDLSFLHGMNQRLVGVSGLFMVLFESLWVVRLRKEKIDLWSENQIIEMSFDV